jgi:DNA modification methylase
VAGKNGTYVQSPRVEIHVHEGRESVVEAIGDLLSPNPAERAVCLHGDAFDLVKFLPDESVDLVLTSPPYWGLRTYGLTHNWEIGREWQSIGRSIDDVPDFKWYRAYGGVLGLEPTPEWFVGHLVEFFSSISRVLKSRGSCWVNLGDTYFARWSSIRLSGRQGLGNNERIRRKTPMGGFRQEKNLLMIPARFAIAMQTCRWILRNDLIWFKPNVPPRSEGDRLRLSHEHFFHFVKRPKEGRADYYYDLSEAEDGALDVVTCMAKSGESGHSATFPTEIIGPRIRSSCPPDGLVLDPFCGTGRALAEAVSSGRKAVGIEITEQFFAVAKDAHRNGTKRSQGQLCLTL